MIYKFLVWLFRKVLGPLADHTSCGIYDSPGWDKEFMDLMEKSNPAIFYMTLHWSELSPQDQRKIIKIVEKFKEKNERKRPHS